MPKIFRLNKVAIYFVIAILAMPLLAGAFYLGVDKGRFERAPYNHTQHYSEYTDIEIGNICGASTTKEKAVECAIRNKAKHRDAKRDEFDLAAQQEMAHWAFWMVVVSFFMLIATLGGAIAVWKTLKVSNETAVAARDSVNATEKLGQYQLRAYIDLHKVRPIMKKGRFMGCKFGVKNFGQTPAKGIKIGIATGLKDGTIFAPKVAPGNIGSLGSGQSFKVELDKSLGKKFFKQGGRFYIVCYIQYYDVFGNLRKSLYRGFVDKTQLSMDPPTFRMDSKHNRMT